MQMEGARADMIGADFVSIEMYASVCVRVSNCARVCMNAYVAAVIDVVLTVV